MKGRTAIGARRRSVSSSHESSRLRLARAGQCGRTPAHSPSATAVEGVGEMSSSADSCPASMSGSAVSDREIELLRLVGDVFTRGEAVDERALGDEKRASRLQRSTVYNVTLCPSICGCVSSSSSLRPRRAEEGEECWSGER